MKVGILIDRVIVGGVSKVAIQEVVALNRLGIDAYLVVLRKEGKASDDWLTLKKDKVIYLDQRMPSIFRFSVKFPMFHFFSTFHLSYPFLLPFYIKTNEFDYLVVHGTFTAFSAISIRKFRGIRFSVFIWDPIKYIINRVYSLNIPKVLTRCLSYTAEILDKFIIKNTSYVLVGGHAHNKYISRFKKTQDIVVIPPGTNPLPNINKIKKSKNVIIATAWKKGKNPEYLFEIVEKIPDIRIKMVGKWLDKEYLSKFKKEILDKGIKSNIEIIGEVSDKKLFELYSKSTVLLQTNDDRGFGMPALEASGCGTTFIIPKGQGVCELFKDKIHGFYTKEKDTRVIVELLNSLLNNEKLAYKMGSSAYELVVKKYSWSAHAQKLIDLIKKDI